MTHREFFTRALSGMFAAVIAVGLAWLVALAVSPDLYAKGLGSDELTKVTLGTALFATVFNGGVGVLVGWLLFWRKKPVTWWYAVSALVLIATFVEAVVMTEAKSTVVWLNVFHLLAAGGIVPSVAISLLDRRETYRTPSRRLEHRLAS
jgi:peptidoglycan/LPS O-acetylase OafA/YrhL